MLYSIYAMKKKENQLLNARAGGFAFVALMCVYMFVNFIGQSICIAVFPDGGKAFIAICSSFAVISILIVTFAVIKKTNCGFSAIKIKKFNCKYIVLAISLSCGMFFGLGFVNNLFISMLEKLGATVGDTVIPLDSVGDLVLFIFLLAILPAIFEEIFFRGVMVSALKNTGLIFAVLAVACCFALYHCSCAQLLYQAIYGAGLTLLLLSSGSLIPCMVAHFLNNFTVLILTYLKVEVDLNNPLFIVFGLIVLIAFFVFSIIEVKKLKISSGEKEEKLGFWLPFGIFGCLICLMVLISSLFVG